MQLITSKDNESVKKIRKLKDKKYRDLNNEYVIEGFKLLGEALNENMPIKKIVICEECMKDLEMNNKMVYEIAKYDCIYVTQIVFKSITDSINPQGILAVITKPENRQIDYNEELMVVIEDVQDPRKFGNNT